MVCPARAAPIFATAALKNVYATKDGKIATYANDASTGAVSEGDRPCIHSNPASGAMHARPMKKDTARKVIGCISGRSRSRLV